jgi:hypothetical protein
MPALFPTLLPEEPLYSAVARYGDMMKFGTRAALHRSVFGVRHVTPSVDLPGLIEAFLSRLLPGHGYTAAEIIERHTAVPYYAAFLPQARVAPVERMLCTSHGRTAASRLGLARGPIRPLDYLRFCETCVEEDRRASHGCAYWRRVHQLPGVVVCPTHDRPLAVSDVDLLGRQETRTFVSLERELARRAAAAHDSAEPADGRSFALRPEHHAVALAVAAGSLWLLQHRAAVEEANLPTPAALWGRYRQWFAASGWAASNGKRISAGAVSEAVRADLGPDLLEAFELVGREAGGPVSLRGMRAMDVEDWTSAMLRRPLRARPAVWHLLLQHFLRTTPERFFSSPPLTSTPVALHLAAPCGNPQCPSYDPPVPRPVRAAVAGDARWVIVSCADCGFRYGQAANERRPQHRKILATGARWDDELRRLSSEPSTERAAFEWALGVSLPVIQRHAVRLGVWHASWSARARRAAEHSVGAEERRERARAETLAMRRTRWMALRETHANASRVELYALDRATYNFLHQFDKAWLLEHLPAPRAWHQPGGRSADWTARDAALLPRVQEAVAAIRAPARRPVQVTIQAVARGIGRANSLRTWLPDLPLTRAFLDAVVEDALAFARRRIVWTAVQCVVEGTTPARMALSVRAALSLPLHHALTQELDEAVAAVAAHADRGAPLPAWWDVELAAAPWTGADGPPPPATPGPGRDADTPENRPCGP